MLVDATDYLFGNSVLVHAPQAEHGPRLFWAAKTPFNPNATTGGAAVVPYANHGRWVVDCPDCHSALLAPTTDLRFMCVECANGANGGQFRPVAWPGSPTRSQVENLLMMRPNQRHRNWYPSETLNDLVAQNLANGVGGIDGKTATLISTVLR